MSNKGNDHFKRSRFFVLMVSLKNQSKKRRLNGKIIKFSCVLCVVYGVGFVFWRLISFTGIVVVDLTMDFGQDPASENYLFIQKNYYYGMRHPTVLFELAVPVLIVITLVCIVTKVVRYKHIVDITSIASLVVALGVFQLFLIPLQVEIAASNPAQQREKVAELAASIGFYHLVLSPFLFLGTLSQGCSCLISYSDARKKSE